jgi:predicted small secreted protein
MKKLIALLLAVAFVCAGVTGCGDTKSTSTAVKPSGSGSPATGSKAP